LSPILSYYPPWSPIILLSPILAHFLPLSAIISIIIHHILRWLILPSPWLVEISPISRALERLEVVGGWSPGPLDALRARMDRVEFLEPTIPMPPSGCHWTAEKIQGRLDKYEE
jgi:hypothetical protein